MNCAHLSCRYCSCSSCASKVIGLNHLDLCSICPLSVNPAEMLKRNQSKSHEEARKRTSKADLTSIAVWQITPESMLLLRKVVLSCVDSFEERKIPARSIMLSLTPRANGGFRVLEGTTAFPLLSISWTAGARWGWPRATNLTSTERERHRGCFNSVFEDFKQ